MTAKPPSSENKILWPKLKRQLLQYDPVKLLELIADLHSLSADNKRFIEAKVINNDNAVEKYRAVISKSINTDAPWEKIQQLDLKAAKKAISEYKKATGNIENIIDLMIYYVERGTQCACDFGDVNENFYCSLELMFDDVLKLMNNHSYPEEFTNRLEKVVASAVGIGWGYSDAITYKWEKWQQVLKISDTTNTD